LWFDGNAEEAMNHYGSIFKDSKALYTALIELLQEKDPEKAKRVMQALLQMSKIDIQTLRQASEQH